MPERPSTRIIPSQPSNGYKKAGTPAGVSPVELDHFGRRLAEASEKLEKAVQSRNPLEMRYTALELVPVLSQYCDSAIKGDSHEMRHIIDALQTAVHTILPETRRAHVHMGKSQSAVQTNDDDLAHAGHR